MASHRALIVGGWVLALALTACGSDGSSASTTLQPLVTTSTAAVTTSTVPATSTTADTTTTSTTTPPSTTTTPPGEQLVMSENGLGTAAFGADADGVVSYVQSILGLATTDSGWVDPVTFGACPGNEVRIVTWNDLALYFSDDSPVASGRRHFMSYIYGPAFAPVINPLGLRTDAGVREGSTVAELRGTYPSVVINDADDLSGPTFFVTDGLFGFLTGITDADTITEFVGGIGCGE